MLIKVCGLKEERNVAQILEKATPDMMGMIFYEKSPRYVETQAADSFKKAQFNIAKVGVFVNASLEEIAWKKEIFGLDFVQLHGDESVSFVTALKEKLEIKIIKVFQVQNEIEMEKLKKFEPLVDYFLFDTQTSAYGGSGKQFDWRVLENYSLQTPFILSGGIDLGHIEEIIAFAKGNSKMVGVDINSKFELSPGKKDADKVSSFINIIREKTINQIDYDRNR